MTLSPPPTTAVTTGARPSPSPPPPAHPAPARLPLVLGVTALNSIATGITYNGLSFITTKAYGYGNFSNSLLALVMGITYVAGALLAGPVLRAVAARWPGVGSRRVLVWIIASAALLNLLPVAAWFATSPEARASSAWAMWVYIALYSALCGSLWPIVESYLSGGRSGARLRRDMGIWNITWSGSLVISLFSIGALATLLTPAAGSAEAAGTGAATGYVLALALGSLIHASAIAVAMALPKVPPAHPPEVHHAVPDSYPKLLAVHRVLLPTAYCVMYALQPLLPVLMGAALLRAGVTENFAAPLAAVWLLARVVTFFVLGQWQGWHGTWLTAWAGTVTLVGGFALCVLAESLSTALLPAADWAPLALQLAGLFVFGCGAAGIYCGALYYVLEVQSAEVEAGGSHEALIGVGYTVGPLCALLPAWMVSGGTLDPTSERPATLLLVGGVTLLAVGAAVWGARRAAIGPKGTADSAP